MSILIFDSDRIQSIIEEEFLAILKIVAFLFF